MSKKLASKRKKVCAICGRKAADGVVLTTHHVFHGNQFKLVSERYGMLLTLCADCHRKLHGSKELDKKVQKMCQHEFENRYSRAEFIAVFKKSWLTSEDDRQYRIEGFLRRAIRVMLDEVENLHLE